MVTGVGGTRFKGLIMEAVGSGCLGHRELTQALPEESAHLPSFCSLCGRYSLLRGRCGVGTSLILPLNLCRAPGVLRVGLLQTVPSGPPSKSVVPLFPPLCSLHLSFQGTKHLPRGGWGWSVCKDAAGVMERWYMMATSLSLSSIRQESLASRSGGGVPHGALPASGALSARGIPDYSFLPGFLYCRADVCVCVCVCV